MLPHLAISPNGTAVAGFGYGGDMAVQAHVAYSATIHGSCGFAAQPIYCAVKKFTREATVSRLSPSGTGVPFCDGCIDPLRTLLFDHCRATPAVVDVGQLPDWPRRNCGEPPRANCLDDVTHMYDSKVYLQSGTRDVHTPTDAVVNTFAWYATMLTDPKAQIKYVGDQPTAHVLPLLGRDGYDGPGECMAHVFGGSGNVARRPHASAALRTFDQRAYLADAAKGAAAGWANEGLVYVPSQCETGECKLLVLLHDCGTRDAPLLPPAAAMSAEESEFARHADVNGVVILMPRLAANASSGAADVRRGCWDVFGQLGQDYAHQSSPHLHPLLPMIQALGGKNASVTHAANAAAANGPTASTATSPVAAPRALPIPLPVLNIDPMKIFAHGSSSGGDMAIQFHIGFSQHVSGVCGGDAQPWRCAATRFDGDVMLPQTAESSTPTCFGCAANETILYDHCKSHSAFVNTTALALAATAAGKVGGCNGGACIDPTSNLRAARIFLRRGECRTYTGSAVTNSRDVYEKLGASDIKYFDQCNPDGSHKINDTTKMCLEHVFGAPARPPRLESAVPAHNFLFPQAPFLSSYDVGFSHYGFLYVPSQCKLPTRSTDLVNFTSTKCGMQVRFHGCGGGGPADPETQAFAEENGVVLLIPNVPNGVSGNNATVSCNAGTAVAGNCKEISRGCWDGEFIVLLERVCGVVRCGSGPPFCL
tara:strand:- start:1479 stop:3599 length:2121 start_codon:yes stop_codon:yes gene_type:complete